MGSYVSLRMGQKPDIVLKLSTVVLDLSTVIFIKWGHMLVRINFFILLVISFTGTSISAHAAAIPETSTAAEVLDGDTIELATGDRVRLIGIDAPEMVDSNNRNAKTAKYEDLRKAAVDLYAVEAAAEAKDWVEGQKLVILTDPINEDRGHRDDYGRVLAYVCRESDGRCLAEDLLSGGYALVYRRFSFDRKDEFLKLEKKARRKARGIWKHQIPSKDFGKTASKTASKAQTPKTKKKSD